MDNLEIINCDTFKKPKKKYYLGRPNAHEKFHCLYCDFTMVMRNRAEHEKSKGHQDNVEFFEALFENLENGFREDT